MASMEHRFCEPHGQQVMMACTRRNNHDFYLTNYANITKSGIMKHDTEINTQESFSLIKSSVIIRTHEFQVQDAIIDNRYSDSVSALF